MTLHDAVAAARRAFEAAGIGRDEAAIDAEVLARHALGWDRTALLVAYRDAPPPDFGARFAPLVARRTRREPVAYITGEREFWGRTFSVGPGVLVPRPETEFIVEEALDLAARGTPPASIIDVGTGSGCLAVSLAVELPQARVTATDASGAALTRAAENASRHGVRDRVELLEGDLFAGAGNADLIVSNPPYVPDGDPLPPEVSQYEPKEALFAGPDGMATIRRLFAEASAHLARGGRLIVEFGFGQEPLVRAAAGGHGWTVERIRPDLQAVPRTAVLRR